MCLLRYISRGFLVCVACEIFIVCGLAILWFHMEEVRKGYASYMGVISVHQAPIYAPSQQRNSASFHNPEAADVLALLLRENEKWPTVLLDYKGNAASRVQESHAGRELEVHVGGTYLGFKHMLNSLSTTFPAPIFRQVRLKSGRPGQVEAVVYLVYRPANQGAP